MLVAKTKSLTPSKPEKKGQLLIFTFILYRSNRSSKYVDHLLKFKRYNTNLLIVNIYKHFQIRYTLNIIKSGVIQKIINKI